MPTWSDITNAKIVDGLTYAYYDNNSGTSWIPVASYDGSCVTTTGTSSTPLNCRVMESIIERNVDTIPIEVDGKEMSFTKENIVDILYQLKSIKAQTERLYNSYAPGMGELKMDSISESLEAIVDVVLGENYETGEETEEYKYRSPLFK